MRHAMDFTQWTNKSAVLQIVIDDLRVVLWGTILGETETAVHFEVDDWRIDIDKSVIKVAFEVDRRTFAFLESL